MGDSSGTLGHLSRTSVIGIEEIFLKVRNMEKAVDFYHGILGIPLDKQDGEKTYLQMERGHLVLQIEDHTGFHQGGGPLHFAGDTMLRPDTRVGLAFDPARLVFFDSDGIVL